MGACLRALRQQRGIDLTRVRVVLVLDACRDGTAAEALRAAGSALHLHCGPGPGQGAGPARALGFAVARGLLGAGDPARLLASTDADTRVGPGWLAAQLEAVRGGAQAIGGRIDLDGREAALLPPAAVAAREARVPARLAAVRRYAPVAEHHQFSGASLAITAGIYDRIGGLPAPTELEDEALERRLREVGIPIAYLRAVRVQTSARLTGRCVRAGLAHALAAGAEGTHAPTAMSDPCAVG